MQRDFYIGSKPGSQLHGLDISSFANLEQLKKTLAHVFAFADTKGTYGTYKHTHPVSIT